MAARLVLSLYSYKAVYIHHMYHGWHAEELAKNCSDKQCLNLKFRGF